jgi:hypothetical protein
MARLLLLQGIKNLGIQDKNPMQILFVFLTWLIYFY